VFVNCCSSERIDFVLAEISLKVEPLTPEPLTRGREQINNRYKLATKYVIVKPCLDAGMSAIRVHLKQFATLELGLSC